MKNNPTPALPLSGEGATSKTELSPLSGAGEKANTVASHRTTPPSDKGEAGRGLKPKSHNLSPQKHTRRQHGIGDYIVEIDGDSHYLKQEKKALMQQLLTGKRRVLL